MKVLSDQSVIQDLSTDKNSISFTAKHFDSFPQGTNKADEYSWFYLLCLQGQTGETTNISANLSPPNAPLTRDNSLVYWSHDRWTWQQLVSPVHTNHTGLPQKYSFTLPSSKPIYLSNTILYDYNHLRLHLRRFVDDHPQLCHQQIIGHSLQNHDLSIISFPSRQREYGRILVTTGCHPAEPDILGSLAILEYLASPAGIILLKHFTVDIMPMQNPDGYKLITCLTANGINLYWNFRYQDKSNCPEAYYLWKYIKKNPPLLYLDFHAYVHQYHRHPMPYLQSLACYTGSTTKKLVTKMDRVLTDLSQGYYKIGSLSMWPDALSTLVTNNFNTIAYTKYHFNMYEGVDPSRQRAIDIFSSLANLLIKHQIKQAHILTPPHGQVTPDQTDSSTATKYYSLHSRLKQIFIYGKSYYRYYRYRHRTDLRIR